MTNPVRPAYVPTVIDPLLLTADDVITVGILDEAVVAQVLRIEIGNGQTLVSFRVFNNHGKIQGDHTIGFMPGSRVVLMKPAS